MLTVGARFAMVELVSKEMVRNTMNLVSCFGVWVGCEQIKKGAVLDFPERFIVYTRFDANL